jgi:hypothetical protein
MSNSLYDEAIADAKQLRDVAEKNAKNAIIEAVTPRIRKFIEDQLVRENTSADDESFISDAIFESEKEEVDEDEEVVLDETALSSLMNLMREADVGDVEIPNSKSEIEKVMVSALGESFTSLSNADRQKILEIAKNLSKDSNNLSNDVIDIDTSTIQENKQMSNDTLYEIDLEDLSHAFRTALNEAEHGDETEEAYMHGVKDQMEAEVYEDEHVEEEDLPLDELDLDSMLKEIAFRLDLDIDEEVASQLSAEDFTLTLLDEEGDEGEEGAEDDLADLDLEMPEEEGELEVADEEALDEVFEIDPKMLKQEIAKMRNSLKEGEAKAMAHHFGGGKAEKDALDFKDTDLNKLAEARHLRKALRSESRKNRALSGKIAEYRGAVGTLREQLTEMNLFNAKLLYVNKLLQSHSMTPTKRRAIIEALDKANNLREVKLLYRSLTESLSGGNARKKSLSESRMRKTGSSSRAVGRASASRSSSATGEVDRWATLAGIKQS